MLLRVTHWVSRNSILSKLSSSSPSPSSHLTRHRQTFFFDRVLASSSNDDNSFINDKIQIPEKNCVHVGFSVRSVEKVEEENDLADISKLCRLLDKLFGIFWDRFDDESFYGARLLFEQQHQKFKFIETLLTVPNDRVPPALNYSFNSVLSSNQTFHTNFHTTVKGNNDEIKGMEDEETCKLLFIHIIPNTFIVDKYQLDDSNDINDNKRIEIFGEMNLESPVGDKSLRWGNVAIISQKMMINVSIPWPLVVCLCDEKSNNNKNNDKNNNIDKPDPLFSQTPLPLSLFYNNKRKQIKYILPMQQNHWPIELVKVPIGQLNHLKIVELWTILVVLIGSFWIFWIVSKKIVAKNAQDKNKID
nr:13168_t:CDS:2 [Entrophospora candida]